MKLHTNNQSPQKSQDHRWGQWGSILLCCLIFLSIVTMRNNISRNGWVILLFETIFIVSHLFARKRDKTLKSSFIPAYSLGFWLVASWTAASTLSLILSPYDLLLTEESVAVKHHLKYLFHIFFFITVKDFFTWPGTKPRWSFLSFPFSCLILSLLMIIAWYALSPEESALNWYSKPPYNGHIRFTGYVAATAAAALLPYFQKKQPKRLGAWIIYLTGLSAWGLLFWCGGRGAILSSLASGGFIGGLFFLKKMSLRRYATTLLVLIVGGFILSEQFAVFDWNGISGSTRRTVKAATHSPSNNYDLEKIAASRTVLWKTSMESLENEKAWLLGLGPYSYHFMPNRIYGRQPHNVFFQILLEWGIIGGSLFILMLGYALQRGIRNHLLPISGKTSTEALSGLAIFVSLSLHSLVSGTFFQTQPMMFLAISLAFLTGTQAKQPSREQ